MTIEAQQVMIRPFRHEDQAAAQALILAGLEEHWGQLDPAYNHDLHDIADAYDGCTFLTAWLDGRLVGTGALIPRDEDTGEIVRMSVDTSLRRLGIGRRILDTLVDQARAAGMTRIVLETTHTWEDAKGFYQSYGFQFTHYHDDDIYFVLNL